MRELLSKLTAIHQKLISVAMENGIGVFTPEITGWSDTILDAMIAIDRASHPPSPAGEGWQPIETAPKNKHVIVAVPHSTIPDGPMRVVEAWWGATNYDRKAKRYNHGWVDHPGHEIAPTHWTPLPAPPGYDAMLAAAPLPPGSKLRNHSFVTGPELGICARCGAPSADAIHHPIFPGDAKPSSSLAEIRQYYFAAGAEAATLEAEATLAEAIEVIRRTLRTLEDIDRHFGLPISEGDAMQTLRAFLASHPKGE